MYFDSFSAFLSMGGYGGYVWSAFGITFLSLGILLWRSIAGGRKIMHEVKAKQLRQARIDAAKNLENTL